MLFLLFGAGLAANQSFYRTCSESLFCARDRTVEKQQWSIAPGSVTISNALLEATIKDGAHDTELRLLLEILVCGAMRIRIEPKIQEPFNRLDLSKEPTVIQPQAMSASSRLDREDHPGKTVLKNGRYRMELHWSPFSLDVFEDGEKRMTVNPDDTAIFETGRAQSKWDEIFGDKEWRGFTDPIKNGPTSVAMDIEFHRPGVRMSGLPSHTLPLTLKQTVGVSDPIRFFNTDVNHYDDDSVMSMYGSVPLLFAHAVGGCDGVFWCNPSETWVDITTDGRSKARFMSEGGYIDLFIFSGTAKTVMNSYTELTGKPQLVPYFALGFHQSRWGYRSSQQVMNVSARLDKAIIPHDMLWLDMEHTNDRRYFTFNPVGFANPGELLDFVAQNKRKLMALVDPHLKADESYSTYKEAEEKGIVIKKPDGSDFRGNCWAGDSVWPDFLNPSAREWWESNFEFDKYLGSGPDLHIWNDMNEITVFEGCEMTAPRDLVHYGDIEEREVHNLYGNLMVSATFGGVVKRTGGLQRPFILSRSFFAGTQKYAAVWSGDNAANWTYLRRSLPMVFSFGLGAQIYNGADIGGFFDTPDQSLLSRWYQVASWIYPFMRCHCHHLSKDREVYTLDNAHLPLARAAIFERYRLLPYWYTLARQANLTGEPILRPLWWEFSNEELLDVDDKAMLGNALLVAPIFDNETEQATIELPKGSRWYDYYSLNEIKTSQTNCGADVVPVYIKGGTIVPSKWRVRKSSSLMFNDPFTLTIAVDENGKAEGELYIDDGETFGFANGEFIHKKFVFDGTKLVSSDAQVNRKSCDFVKKYHAVIEKVRITGIAKSPSRVTISGQDQRFTHDAGILTIHRPQIPVKDDIEVLFHF